MLLVKMHFLYFWKILIPAKLIKSRPLPAQHHLSTWKACSYFGVMEVHSWWCFRFLKIS